MKCVYAAAVRTLIADLKRWTLKWISAITASASFLHQRVGQVQIFPFLYFNLLKAWHEFGLNSLSTAATWVGESLSAWERWHLFLSGMIWEVAKAGWKWDRFLENEISILPQKIWIKTRQLKHGGLRRTDTSPKHSVDWRQVFPWLLQRV